MSERSSKPSSGHVGKNPLEWSIFILSSVLVVCMLAWLSYSALTAPEPEVKLTVVAQQATEHAGWYRIPVVVNNEGGMTASGVQVTVVVEIEGRNEQASFALDHVPRGGSRRGMVSFRGNSAPENITPVVMGFSE